MPSKIVVFGATGYAGGLAVEALRRRGLRPVLAGTREDALRDLSRRLDGLDYQRANAADLDSVRSLVGPGDVLVTTVGPFERIGFPFSRQRRWTASARASIARVPAP